MIIYRYLTIFTPPTIVVPLPHTIHNYHPQPNHNHYYRRSPKSFVIIRDHYQSFEIVTKTTTNMLDHYYQPIHHKRLFKPLSLVNTIPNQHTITILSHRRDRMIRRLRVHQYYLSPSMSTKIN